MLQISIRIHQTPRLTLNSINIMTLTNKTQRIIVKDLKFYKTIASFKREKVQQMLKTNISLNLKALKFLNVSVGPLVTVYLHIITLIIGDLFSHQYVIFLCGIFFPV